MKLRPSAVEKSNRIFLLVACLLLGGCSRSANSPPTIVFSRIPKADKGGPDKVDAIEGSVTGNRPGQRIVLYARSEDLWWIQPFTEHPFTEILDFRWKNKTHLGTDYAALLVDPGFKPPQTAENLPTAGGGVAAVASVKGEGPAPPAAPVKTIHFSGYDWTVRSAGSYRGGSHNSFAIENAWTDDSGALHLRISKRGVDWMCSEVKLTRSLGYGTYRFTVRDVSQLEPSAVLTLSTWDGVGNENDRRELDIEISRWGLRSNQNAQFVVQPYYIPVNLVRFQAPRGKVTQSFRWDPGQATFSTTAGAGGAKPGVRVITQHVFTSGVPSAGGDSVRINLYALGSGAVPLKNETEVVIEKFEYLP